jgi:phosphoenolpyruvate carboxykinase (GTP)
MPSIDQFDLEGLPGFDREKLKQVLAINREDWKQEILMQEELFLKLYSDLPKELLFQKELLIARL